jgi:hypothetical protein
MKQLEVKAEDHDLNCFLCSMGLHPDVEQVEKLMNEEIATNKAERFSQVIEAVSAKLTNPAHLLLLGYLVAAKMSDGEENENIINSSDAASKIEAKVREEISPADEKESLVEFSEQELEEARQYKLVNPDTKMYPDDYVVCYLKHKPANILSIGGELDHEANSLAVAFFGKEDKVKMHKLCGELLAAACVAANSARVSAVLEQIYKYAHKEKMATYMVNGYLTKRMQKFQGGGDDVMAMLQKAINKSGLGGSLVKLEL